MHLIFNLNPSDIKKLLFFIFVFNQNAFAQNTLSIEQFKNTADFYTSFNEGSGSIDPTTNTTDFVAGNASLQINYTFDAGSGTFFSSLRNYANATKDWSLSPLKLTLRYKGGNSETQIRLRLWEDIDRDGQFNNSDEVFVSPASITGQNTWTVLEFNFDDFTRLAGNGNNYLDMERIRAWDIAVENNTSSSISGELILDELALISNYIPPTNGDAKLSGSFIQLWNDVGCKCGQYSLQQWKDEIQKMKDACLSTIYIQYSVYDNLTWYSPSNLPFVSFQSNALNKIFEAAELLDFNIYVGMYFDETWNSNDKSDVNTYSDLLSKQQQSIDEIWNLFGNSPSFKGWYIPQEINDLEWQTNPQKNLLFSYIQNVAQYAHQKNSSKPVMIAPFFNLWQPADVLANWYNEFFSAAPDLNQVFFQDGVGITLKNTDYHLPLYFPLLKQVCSNSNVDFGVTVESFQQLSGWPIDEGIFSATSTDINRLKKQLWEADLHKPTEIIHFSWMYTQPNNTTQSNQLFNDYKAYSNCTLTKNQKIKSEYEVQAYPIPASNELFLKTVCKKIIIYDLRGQVVLLKTDTKHLDISKIKPGRYILSTVLENNIQTTQNIIVY